MAKIVKLPKRIAGVKIPKRVRNGPLADLLVLAAGVYGVSRLTTQSGAPGAMRENIEDASSRLSHAFAEAYKVFRATLDEPAPVHAKPADDTKLARSEDWPETHDTEEAVLAKKKRATLRAEPAEATS